ncbi:MAG: hypothetical protein ACRDRU_25600 [Pseudonocardiaceae bacterium]
MDRRKTRRGALDSGWPGGWPGSDFLSQVREVCRLRTDQDRSTSGAEILERSRGAAGVEFDHLVVCYTRGPWTKELVVGVCDGPASAETVTHFRDAVCAHITTEREPELVYRGPADAGAEHAAREHGIWLRDFAEYQHVWEHHRYLAAQTQRLRADPEYPLQRHVDKRWSELGEATPTRPRPPSTSWTCWTPTVHGSCWCWATSAPQDVPVARAGRATRPGGQDRAAVRRFRRAGPAHRLRPGHRPLHHPAGGGRRRGQGDRHQPAPVLRHRP